MSHLRSGYQPGELLNNNQLIVLQEALRGGMGEVYRCRETRSGAIVAVKMIRNDLRGSTLTARLLKQEATNWLEIGKQRNIVQFISLLHFDSRFAMLSEWIEPDGSGRTSLVDWLRSRPLPLQETLDFAMDIGRGLDHAQIKVPGIVHRDLKPSNVLIGWTGFFRGLESQSTPERVYEHVAKINDWGLATVTEEVLRDQLFPRKAHMQGTPLYKAPEQWIGRQSDARTDVYALGCILFEMLTGRVPFGGTTSEQLERAHIGGRIPRLPATIQQSKSLQAIVDRCLAKDNAERYDYPMQLVFELARIYEDVYEKTPRGVESDAVILDATYSANRGNAYFSLGQDQKALECYEEALESEPTLSDAHLGCAIVYLNRGDYQRAIEKFDIAIGIDPKVAQFYANRGIASRRLKNFEAALSDFSKAIELDPTYNPVYANRGNLYLATGDLDRALADYIKAIELAPGESMFFHNRGLIYKRLGQQERALEDLTEAIRLEPTDPQYYLDRAEISAFLNKEPEAISDCTKAIDQDPTFIDAFCLRSDLYRRLGAEEKADRDDEMIVRLRSRRVDTDVFSKLETIHDLLHEVDRLRDLHLFHQAIDVATSAIAQYPMSAKAYLERGTIFNRLDCFEDAVADFTRVLELDTHQETVFAHRGEAYMGLGQNELAIHDLDVAIARDPSDSRSYFNRALGRQRLGQLELADQDYTAAIDCDPDYHRAYNNRGFVREGLGDERSAIADFEKACQLDPEDADYFVSVAAFYTQRGKLIEAVPYVERAFWLGDEEAAALALNLRKKLGYVPPEDEDPVMVGLQLLSEAVSSEDVRRSIMECPFMSTRLFLKLIQSAVSRGDATSVEFAPQYRWLCEILETPGIDT